MILSLSIIAIGHPKSKQSKSQTNKKITNLKKKKINYKRLKLKLRASWASTSPESYAILQTE